MKYVIFGAGFMGGCALNYLGYVRVLCYVDNYAYGKQKEGKDVISFEELLKLDLDNIIVVIANVQHCQEIEQQLQHAGNIKYFVFYEYDPYIEGDTLPRYSLNKRMEVASYNRILSCYNLSGYSRIAVLGVNRYIHYLISEIAMQYNYENIVEIISEESADIEQCLGIPIVTWEDADKDFDCLIVNMKRHTIKNLERYENANFDLIDLYDADMAEHAFHHPELEKYKDMYKGKRIFVIGNGPSLTIDDLNTLHQHHEICIASNNFYRVYDQTDFRADFHVISDQDVIEDNKEEVKNIPGHLLVGDGYHMERPDHAIEGIQYFHSIFSNCSPNRPKFSKDISEGIYRGSTVTYDSLQLAAYLGAKEIYLLGMDHSFTNDLVAEENHFIKNYMSDEERERFKKRYKNIYGANLFETDNINRAYETAELYSRKHGFRIYNATRGGKLEIFERVDFDSLFDNAPADSNNS